MFDSSKLKEFADDKFKVHDMAESSPNGRQHCGKRRNCSLRALSPFPTVVSKDLHRRHEKKKKKQGLFGKGLKL